ncbi:ATP-binding cassette domain-containing protein [Corallococcus sp. AB049A]|uniref:ABC transporter ATP-binding protein n=1 Tax=Corallococcus sp. AB049A TaxID=2316721 RepID=UPI000EA3318E|nr:ATP-binding cassette domain-containing protein [Corallococcus sp. AB049A]RKH51891.1 ATP-binding cassette domain-containing protein [Corallococcus sp. AB050B]RKI71588.1 ATP-binding cassette domain-containing protein [Corallococcus sp. AB049A]
MDLRAEALSLRYGARTVLEPTDCHVPPGTQALVLGRSGSGKTTLLKSFAGLLLPSSGRVTWNGQDVARLSAPERRVQQASFGFVFQTDALFDSLTVRQNVMQPLLRRRVPEDEARERTDAVLRSVGLADAADTLPERLSGGMKKRAGLARAIAARPAVLLADDPFAGLDPGTARQVARVLLEVAGQGTLLVAAPEAPVDLPLPRWLYLRGGRLVHDGAPAPELERAPDEALA